MLHLIPKVKKLEMLDGFFTKNAIFYNKNQLDARLSLALEKLPFDAEGAVLDIILEGEGGEGYKLSIEADAIHINADGPAGAFYAIQTLRQIWEQGSIQCLRIEDEPDFGYRGFYHDITRGKVPTLDTIKELIDRMAYYKLNSLQLYVEHTFEFEECREFAYSNGCITAEAIKELDAYCRDRFIDFIPSIATFGHMYEILRQDKYRHLRVLSDFEETPHFWYERMVHHTIDPLKEESFEVVKSLIDQYYPLFSTDTFNICGDETFDLKNHKEPGVDVGQMYVDFVNKIIAHLKGKGKKIMMWADILLQYPETIDILPEDTCFLNWTYSADPSEESVEKLASYKRTQIVCPGTSTWRRLCENTDVAEKNIGRLIEYGKKHGAIGVLNTNWGDYGNICSLELSMFGMIWGAEKSWSVATKADGDFYSAINFLNYKNDHAKEYIDRVSALQSKVNWTHFCNAYYNSRYNTETAVADIEKDTVAEVQSEYIRLRDELSSKWEKDEYRRELLIAAEGICVIAELFSKLIGSPVSRVTDTRAWLAKYRGEWVAKNKESELSRIEEMFLYLEDEI